MSLAVPLGAAQAGGILQSPCNSLALLMIAQAVVVLPHMMQLSPWIIAVCLLCGVWRTRVYQGKSAYPSRGAKAMLVVLGTIGAFASGAGPLSLEVFVSMVVIAFALKLVEMNSRRDAFLVIFLCYFIIAAEFLFDQSLGIAVYQVFTTVVVTAAMIGLNQMHTDTRPLDSARLAGGLVLQAIPLAVVLFLFFPRRMPLWSMPLPGNASTGLAESMTPGDIATLTQSGEPAFRVQFDGPTPQYRDLYWRAVVYSDFREGTWRLMPPIREEAQFDVAPEAEPVSYDVLMHPTSRPWLYSLDVPVELDGRITLLADFRLESEHPVTSTYRYRLRSVLAHQRGEALSPAMYQRETRLPEGDNPRMIAFAKTLHEKSGSVERFAMALMQHIRSEAYAYTLSPQTLPAANSVDTFWFDTRRGFCAHYAGAFVYAMRAAGIPARLVGGYLGGEVNPIGGYLMVRQYDAQGWAEVWIEGQGWVRYDPTAAVAPERIESGPAEALSAEDRSNFSLLAAARLDAESITGQVLQMFDSMEHRWNLFVVGYDGNIQKRLLGDWFGDVSATRIGLIMVGFGAVCFGVIAFFLFFRRRSVAIHPGVVLLTPFSRFVSRYGFALQPGELPEAWLRRIGDAVGFEADANKALSNGIEAMLYGDAAVDDRQLRRLLRRLRWKVALSFR